MRDAFIVVFRNAKDATAILEHLPEMLLYLLGSDKAAEVSEDSVTQEQLRVMTLNRVKSLWNESRKWPWKKQSGLIKVLPELSSFFGVDEYNGYFVDILFEALKIGNKVTKHEIMNSMCKLLAANYRTEKRKAVLKILVELSKASSYYDRENFLIFCEAALNHFSLALFKEYEVIDKYFAVMEDRVSNIRLKAICVAIPLWRFAGDLFREEIKERLSNLRNDKNKEVRQYADSTLSLLQLKAVEFRKEDASVAERNAVREAAEKDLEKKEEEEKEEEKESREEKTTPLRKLHTVHSATKPSFAAERSFGKPGKDIKSAQKKSLRPSGTVCSVVAKGKKIKSFVEPKAPQLGKSNRKISDTDSRCAFNRKPK